MKEVRRIGPADLPWTSTPVPHVVMAITRTFAVIILAGGERSSRQRGGSGDRRRPTIRGTHFLASVQWDKNKWSVVFFVTGNLCTAVVPVCEMDTPCCGKQCCSVVYETSRHHVRPTCAVVVIAFRSRTYVRCLFLQAVFFRRPWIVSQTLGIKSVVTALLRAAWCFAEGRYRWTSLLLLLGAFAKFRKAAVSCVMSACLSVSMEQLGFHCTDFHEIWYLYVFRKSRKFKFH